MIRNRVVDFGAYTDEKLQVLKSVLGQMSDGIWENSPNMEGYWYNIRFEQDGDNIVAEINSNNYYTDCRKRFKPNPYARMSDAKVIEFIAKKLKKICIINARDMYNGDATGKFASNNEDHLQYLGYKYKPTYSEAYTMYKELLAHAAEQRASIE